MNDYRIFVIIKSSGGVYMKCPKCGSEEIIPIVYGYPTKELFDQSKKGEVIIGGCCIVGEVPNRHCKNCGEEFSVEDKVVEI